MQQKNSGLIEFVKRTLQLTKQNKFKVQMNTKWKMKMKNNRKKQNERKQIEKLNGKETVQWST